MENKEVDVIVVGAGHSGIEAACAAARMGVKTLLITKSKENLGEMSCNPAIGGVAKGTIVKEVDALDGIMAKAIDMAGIHFRILNASKGPAVHSPRAQADRKLYKKAINEIVKDYENLEIIFSSVEDLILGDNTHIVVLDNGEEVITKSIVLTTGTFLRGLIHIGNETTPAGRVGEKPSYGISKRLEELGFELGRLKTGTPPRILKSSINFSELEKQPSDNIPTPFSYLNDEISTKQIDCFITYTNPQTHETIKDNLDKSPLHVGSLNSSGPRYCPSIEDKVRRFYDKERHQIFLEPEGLDSDLIYPNGISTSLPQEVQLKFLRTIKGLENCEVTKAGYAIEYDFVDPRQLQLTLETKKVKNLFFAGQINGTTGYEEAAGQGIIAGINAAFKSQNSKEEFTLDRSNSYVGVMIDDLTSMGTNEPYRMLTSRAEYRLSLRADNADLRLTDLGIKIGVVKDQRKNLFEEKKEKIKQGEEILRKLTISPKKLEALGVKIKQDGIVRDAITLLSFQNINFEMIEKIWPKDISQIDAKTKNQIAINALYSAYLSRQRHDLELFKKEENMKIPLDINYNNIQSLSLEVREKLNKFKPSTISQASKIQGITPASVMSVMIYIKNNYKKND